MSYFDIWVGNIYCKSMLEAIQEMQALTLTPAEVWGRLEFVMTGQRYDWHYGFSVNS